MSSNGSKKKAKQAPAAPKQIPKRRPGKKSLAVIIAAIAVIVAAAVAASIYFFAVKPRQEDDAETSPSFVDRLGDEEYELVAYRDGKMPKVFAELLTNAQADSAAACEKHGVALTVGEQEISLPEFVCFYYDACYRIIAESFQTNLSGINRTGYNYSQLPSAQEHPNKKVKWSQVLSEETFDAIQSLYATFNAAVSAGTTLDNMIVNDIYLSCMSVHDYADNKNMTPNELLEQYYYEDLTLPIYASTKIMYAYVTQYKEDVCRRLREECPEDLIQAELDNNPNKAVVYARLVPVEDKEYDPADVAKIKNEKTFLEFAKKENGPFYSNYDPAVSTRMLYVDYDTIDTKFGGDVAQWMFDPSREAGDFAMLNGEIYPCAVLIMSPAQLTCSFDYHAILLPFNDDYSPPQSDSQKENAKQLAQSIYDRWKEGDATLESFDAICVEVSPNEDTVYHGSRASESLAEIATWALDDSRKLGDCDIIEVESGYCIAYFIKKNLDDPDWRNTFITDRAEELYTQQNEQLCKNSPVVKNSSKIKKAMDYSDKLCSEAIIRLDERRKRDSKG